MTEEQMIAMKIGEHFYLPKTSIQVLRVPAGWIYAIYDSLHRVCQASTFVPEPIYDDIEPDADDLK